MKWFGQMPFSPVCGEIPRVPVPIDDACGYCDEPIAVDDDGYLVPHLTATGMCELPWHAECQFRSLVGGLNHLRGSCTCCGGQLDPDPPDVTKRTAARMVVAEYAREVASKLRPPSFELDEASAVATGSTCPMCGEPVWGASDPYEGTARAGPGAICICSFCAGVIMIDEDRTLRVATPQEINALSDEHKTKLTQMVAAVKRFLNMS